MRARLIVCALLAPLSLAHAAGGPDPGAVTAEKAKLPDGPGSVRGLASDAEVAAAMAQVRYAIPIEVPAGLHVAPGVALSYSGELGNGPLGIGWAFEHASIRRSTRHGVPAFDDSDELELSGAGDGRLVKIADGSYRVEGAGHSFRAERSGNRWVVTDGEGVRYHFGLSPSGRQEAVVDGVLATTAWFLELVVHPTGSTVELAYRHDRGQVYLAGATWGPGRRYTLAVEHEARQDIVTSHREGFEVVTALRVRAIQVRNGSRTLRSYQLTYDDAHRLARVIQRGLDGEGALPPVALAYAPRQPPRVEPLGDLDGWRLDARGTSLFDVDGDGMEDLLRLEMGNHRWRKNLGGRFAAERPLEGAPAIELSGSQLLDLDGDARADLVRVVDDTWRWYKLAGERWLPMGEWPGTRGLPLGGVLVDLDGDGRTDVVEGGAGSLRVTRNGPGGMRAPKILPAISASDPTVEPGTTGVRFTDVNGDGLADVVWLTDSWMKVFLGEGDGRFVAWRRVFYPWGAGAIRPADVLIGDLDRDGHADLVRLTAGHALLFRGLGDGVFGGAEHVARPEGADADVVVTLADANGNGSADLVWSSPRGMWVLDLAGATSAGMLARIDNGLGQATSFRYEASALLSVAAEQAGQPWARKLPVSIPVPVGSDVVLPGQPLRRTVWGVRDGFWDPVERRFGGFLETRHAVAGATGADTAVVVTGYLTGEGDQRVLRGKTAWVRSENGLGERYTESTTEWRAHPVVGLEAHPLLWRAVATRATTTHHEGVTQPITTATWSVVDEEGRPIQVYDAGRTDLSGDERLTVTRFARATAGVRDRICEEEVYEGDGTTRRSHTRRYFGGPDGDPLPLCEAGLGLERAISAWHADEGRWLTYSTARYDGNWNLVESVSKGVTRSYAYDASGLHVVRETLAPGVLDLVHTVVWDEVLDLMVGVTDPSGVVRRVGYDSLGRLAWSAWNQAPADTFYRYEWRGPRPATHSLRFDGRVEDLGPPPAVFTPGSGWRESVAFVDGSGAALYTATRAGPDEWLIGGWNERDARGRVVLTADAFAWRGAEPIAVTRPAAVAVNRVAYDGLGRITEKVAPTGARARWSYAAFTTTTQVDGMAPVIGFQDGLGRTRRTQRTISGVLESADASHDAAGRLLSLRLQAGQPEEVEHRWRYDSLGRVTFASDPDAGDRHHVYDDAGRLIERRNAAGQAIHYGYDPAGRLRTVDADDGSRLVYHHDTARDGETFLRTRGRLAWVEEPTGRVELGYDAMGRRAHQRREIDGEVADEVIVFTVGGKPARVDFRDGVAFDLGYDDIGRTVRIGDFYQLLEADPSGRVLHERFGNGVEQTYRRDAQGQTSATSIGRAGGQALLLLDDITRTPYGAITAQTDLDGRGLDHSAGFSYDEAARLTAAWLGAPGARYTFGYGYDGLQNMVRRSAAGPGPTGALTGDYRYGEPRVAGGPRRGPRQLTSIAGAAPSVALDYDAAGRQVQQGALVLRYNGLDQLISVTGLDTGSGEVEHAYGYDSQRVRTRGPDGTAQLWFSPAVFQNGAVREHVIMLGDRLIARVSQVALSEDEGSMVASGLLGLLALLLAVGVMRLPRGRRLRGAVAEVTCASMVLAGCGGLGVRRRAQWGHQQTLYYHQTVAPGPTLITRGDGSVLEERRYEPFGDDLDAYRETPAGEHGAVDFAVDPFGIVNKPTDPSTGWSYHGARWMAPETARWLTPDPPVEAPDPAFMARPWSLHPYQYARQAPTLFWDPDGREDKLPEKGPWNPPGDQPAHFYIGNACHASITAQYQAKHAGSRVYANFFSIWDIAHAEGWNVLKALSDRGASDRIFHWVTQAYFKEPDLLRIDPVDGHAVFEIRPANDEQGAWDKAIEEVNAMKWGGVNARMGDPSDPGAHGIAPGPDGYCVYGSKREGTIIYRYRKNLRKPTDYLFWYVEAKKPIFRMGWDSDASDDESEPYEEPKKAPEPQPWMYVALAGLLFIVAAQDQPGLRRH